MNDHLAKPIDPDKLFAALLRWIRPRSASADVAALPAASRASSPVDEAPLKIPGIDTQAALKRTGGNRQRYESLLRRFAESQAGAAQEIRTSLSANDAETAQRTAHSLKGAAGNLGASALATAAGSAEIAIKTQAAIEPAMRELERSLAATMNALDAAFPATTSKSLLSAEGDPAAVVQPLSRLKQLLKSDDSEAAEFIVEARAPLAVALTGTEMDNLTRLVADFDYEAALGAVTDIAERLSLKLD
jgi:two-component system sensor histidine kinase/response regulator